MVDQKTEKETGDSVYARVNRNNLSYRMDIMEKWKDTHEKENCTKIEKLDERVDSQNMRTEKYYNVVTPEEIKAALEKTHTNEMELAALSVRFNDFMMDRVRRLEVANDKIDLLKDTIAALEAKLVLRGTEMESSIRGEVDANKIKNQQYVITIVVGIIITFLSSIVLIFLRGGG